MELFSATLRRHLGTIGLSILIAAGVVYYALAYVPQQTAELNGLYFRVLERIGLNVQQKINAQFKVQEGIADQIIRGELIQEKGSKVDSINTKNKIITKWASLSREIPYLAFENLRTKPTYNLTQPQPQVTLDTNSRLLFMQPLQRKLKNPKTDINWTLLCSLPLDSLVHTMRRPDVFRQFFIFDPITRHLLYSSSPGLLTEGSRKHPPVWFSDTTGIWAGKSTKIILRGQFYYLFAQPLRLTSGGEWILCGAVPAAQFDANRHSISAITLEASLSLLLIGLLSLPFLKLAFMSPHERLNRIDVFMCSAALVFGSGLVTLGFQSFIMRHWLERNGLENQLQNINQHVCQNLIEELGRLNTTIRTADNLGRDNSFKELIKEAKANSTNHSRIYNKLSPGFSWRQQQVDTSDVFVWIDANGHGSVSMAQAERYSPNYIANLSGRRYFQAAQKIPTQRSSTEPDYYFDNIITYKDAKVSAALARPSSWPDLKREGAVGVCLLITTLQSLTRPVLPPGYSFCLIDERGEVLFHSDPRLSLSENLLEDAEPSNELRSAVFANQKTFTQGRVQGKARLLYLSPLKDTLNKPVTTFPGRYVVTMVDLENIQDWQLQTLSEATVLLMTFWLLLLLLAGLLLAAIRRPHTLLAVQHSFPRLWPRRDYTSRYSRILAANGFGLTALLVITPTPNAPTQLFILLVLPLYLYLFTYHELQLKSERQHNAFRLRIIIVLLILLGLNLFIGNWIGWRQWELAIRFQSAVGIGLLVLSLPGSRWSDRFALPGLYGWLSPSHYRRAYTCMLLSWILLLGIVPALYCYQIANGIEQMYQIRFAHLSIFQQLHQQPANAHAQSKTPSNQYFFDFFSTEALNNPDKSPIDFPKGNYASFSNWKHKNYSIRTSREFFGLVHHSFAANAHETRKALPTSAKDSVEMYSWAVEPPEKEHSGNVKYASKMGETWLCSYSQPIFSSKLLWFSVPVDVESNLWFNPMWVLPTLLLLLVWLLYRLIRYSARWIFAPAVFTHRNTSTALDPDNYPHTNLIHRFLLTPSASTLEELPQQERNSIDDSLTKLDCRLLPTLDKADQWLKTHIANTIKVVVVEQFEYAALSPEQTERKRTILEWLIRRNKQVIILSRLHPAAFADCGHTLEKACPVPGHALIQQAGSALLDTLAPFRAEYLQIQSYRESRQVANLFSIRGELYRSLPILNIECASMPFLFRLRKPLFQALQQRWKFGQRLGPDNIILAVQRMAQFYYRSLWKALSPQEQFFLYDMAQDGLVNPRSTIVMDTLVQKGFLKVDTHGRLRLINDSFRSFILSAVKTRQALRFEQENTFASTWAALHLPMVLLLSAGALFIFVTQRSVMTEAQQFLTAFLSLLPLLGRLLTGFLPGAGAGGKLDIKA